MGSRPLSSLKRSLLAFAAPPSATVGEGVQSVPYRQSMFRRPPTVRRSFVRRNSCSFIGTVVCPVKRLASRHFGVYTFLEVKGRSAGLNPSSFRILLAMLDELAEISLNYLKPNDLIYVRGHLGSYEKHNGNGNHETFYKVFVKDLNFIKLYGEIKKPMEPGSSVEESSTPPASKDLERRDRLHLWQIFFANPHEWWDNRQNKSYSGLPDFKHKDTNERLWLREDDPPWVRRQLQLYDSSMRTQSSGSKVHGWKVKDLEL
ncbi:hypothetical protein Cni_G16555 [Canna indica]|uniref:Protein OSB1, mitochondrial n=1 Tax=Canna indica TaxID=4628 RepID=A0AAQ3QCN2_9LILI|nr:hypothetical protein Cni_G16555 [Canna indica]